MCRFSLSSILLLFLALPTVQAQEVRLSVSDLLHPLLAPVLEAQAEADGPEVLAISQGSILAQGALERGEVAAALVAWPEGSTVPAGYVSLPYCFQVAVIAVHRSNPLTQLDLDEARALYGSGSSLSRWGELGLEGIWSTRQINLNALRQSGGLALELFKVVVLQVEDMRASVNYYRDFNDMMVRLLEDNGAVVLAPTNRLPDYAKPVQLSARANSPAFPPTDENVLYGDYILRLPFHLLLPANLGSEDLRRVVALLYSDTTAEALVEAFYLPLPESERRSYIESLELGE